MATTTEETKTTPATENEVDLDKPDFEFKVTMNCSGCSTAVDRLLGKLEGVKSHKVSLNDQTAKVWAEPGLDFETVLRTIKKTGKKVTYGEERSVAKSVDDHVEAAA